MKFKIKFSSDLGKFHNKYLQLPLGAIYKIHYNSNGFYTVFRKDNSIITNTLEFRDIIRCKIQDDWKILDENPEESD